MKTRNIFSLSVVLLAMFGLAGPLSGQTKAALVIGNGAYAKMPRLKNPANDAADLAGALRKIGFKVSLLTNANRRDMNQAIVAFRETLAADRQSEGVFFFAGHGIQAKGVNYLMPVNADVRAEIDLEDEAISAQKVLGSLDEARNRVNLVILDACRDNPLPASVRSTGRGLAVVGSAPPETVVLYSTGAGQVAEDGAGRNSPFTQALLAHMSDAGDITQTIKKVSARVKSSTNGRQTPYLYSSLTMDFTLNAAARAPLDSKPAIAARPPEGMVFVEGGTFSMGDDAADSYERPIHQVTVSGFYMARTEVTQKQFSELIGFNPSWSRGDDLPVEMVSWYDAAAFCNEKSRREGLRPVYSIGGIQKSSLGNISSAVLAVDWTADGYRLPTEAEWEYAAKGGKRSGGYKYAGGNEPDPIAWYDSNAGGKLHPVGKKPPNELGLYDLSGNVWEWCWDFFGVYDASSQTDPRGASSGQQRILRGGAWNEQVGACRSTARGRMDADAPLDQAGFRPVRSAP